MIRVTLPGPGAAAFTERAEGNLSTMRGAGHEHGAAARDRVCEVLGLARLCAGAQVHGTNVQRAHPGHGSNGAATAKADGQATNLAGSGMMVLTADCLPVIVASPRAVAAVHAGWRGLAAGVLEEGVRAVRDVGAVEPGPSRAGEQARGREIVAIIGPGAGPCCYEVGPEVHVALSASTPRRARPAARAGRGPGAPIDLKAIARERLLAAGVDSVQDIGLCTICDARFFSHRREAQRAGRQAGIAWLS